MLFKKQVEREMPCGLRVAC